MRRNKGKSSFPASSLTPRSPSPSTYSNQAHNYKWRLSIIYKASGPT
ncbi:hypothetical protein BDE02_18G072300 [Populus trichocarpa]|nr:hypothetical protein BDE02_18G072300 [Populus trichocarpa]